MEIIPILLVHTHTEILDSLDSFGWECWLRARVKRLCEVFCTKKNGVFPYNTPFPPQAIVFSKLSSWKFSSLPLTWGARQFSQRDAVWKTKWHFFLSVSRRDGSHTLAIFPGKWSDFLHVHVKLISIYSVWFVSLSKSLFALPNCLFAKARQQLFGDSRRDNN